MSETLRGQLLVAAPILHDPNFHRTVVLVAEHDDDGAMGIVLNRPTDTAVGLRLMVVSRLAGVCTRRPVPVSATLEVMVVPSVS